MNNARFTITTSIEEMAFSVRTYNKLKSAGIKTLGEILSLTIEDLERLKSEGNFLINCMGEVTAILEKHGYEIPD